MSYTRPKYYKVHTDEHEVALEPIYEELVPVVRGRWIPLDECSNAGVYCSVCHKKVYKECYANVKVKSNYCPNCGAKME